MSESNLYCTLYFDNNEKQDKLHRYMTEPELKQECFHDYIEGFSKEESLSTISFFSGNIIVTEIVRILKKFEPEAMLLMHHTDTGSNTRLGYIKNKKESYVKAEVWMSERSSVIAFQILFNKGNRKEIEVMLNEGFDLNNLPFFDDILLHCCIKSQTPLMLLLIQHGANPNVLDNKGVPILLKAVKSNNVKLVEALLEKGADPMALMPESKENALHLAIRCWKGVNARKMCKWFISQGIDVNHKNTNGATPLMYLPVDPEENPLSTLKLFEKSGANLHCETEQLGNLLWQAYNEKSWRWGWLPVNKSVLKAKNCVSDYLIEKGLETKIPMDVLTGETAFADHMIEGGVVKVLDIAQYPQWFSSDFMTAVENDDLEAAKKAVKEEVVYFNLLKLVTAASNSKSLELLNYIFSLGMYLPDKAFHAQIFLNIEAVSSYRSAEENLLGIERLSIFIKHGLQIIDFSDTTRYFAHCAIVFDSPSKLMARNDSSYDDENRPVKLEFVKMVINEVVKAGININAQDKEGHTMLMLAADKAQFELVNHLLDKEASQTLTSAVGETALDIALREGKRMTRHWQEDTQLRDSYSNVISMLGGDYTELNNNG